MKPVTEEDIGPGGEAEWQRLRRQVELAEGFWLGFIFSPSPLSSGVLRRRTERLLRGQTRRLESFQPDSPAALKGLLPSLFTLDVASAGCAWVEALHLDLGDGTEQPWREAWLELVSRMNERRDALRRHMQGGLVLVAPPEMKLPIREAASDLWSIRALVVELPLVAEGLPRESHLNTASFSERSVSGQASEADALTEFALAESERLMAKATIDDPHLIEVLLRRVDALLSSGRTGEAVEAARRARELAIEQSRAEPRLQAMTLHKLALAEKAYGDLAAAEEHLAQAVKVLGSFDNRYRSGLLSELANIALELGELASALAAYEESLALDRQFRAALGDAPEALHELSVSLNKVGDVQLRLGQLSVARAAYEESLNLRRQIRTALGDTPSVLHELSVALGKVGDVQQSLGHIPAVSAAYEESLTLRRQLRAAVGDKPEVLRNLSISLERVGDVQRSLGHRHAASTAFEESLSLRRQLRAALGDKPEVLHDLSISLDRVGNVQEDLGDLSAANVAYEESLALRRQIRDALGNTPAILRGISISLNNVGDVRQLLGNLSAARAAYEESLVLTRQLRAVLGDIPEALRDLGVTLDRVGNVQNRLGNLPAARAAYEEVLILARQLYERMGDIPQAIEDLATSLKNVAIIRDVIGDSVGAAVARKEAQTLRSRLKE
ncbi:tetratricopeptide repeat protein [Archangium sp.]|jgi:tetratricopeptide (TPR) repeat protein|uniref:tetratricopeptide repeat protein n=1 Tax=Archangium sp. TaxID=1872627 RepID=UPI002ED7B9A7